jgi:hypothetical protein
MKLYPRKHFGHILTFRYKQKHKSLLVTCICAQTCEEIERVRGAEVVQENSAKSAELDYGLPCLV